MARFTTGFGTGVTAYALPIYNAELAPPTIRGMTGGLFQLNTVVGTFLSTFITLYLHVWQVAICLPAIPAVVLAILIWLVPETPRFVMRNYSFDEGALLLKRFRKGDCAAEARDIQSMLILEQEV